MLRPNILVVAALVALASCAPAVYRDTSVPIGSIASFDAARYTGLWYEVASYPTPFQTGCRNTTARYSPLPDGGIAVVNRCVTENGETSIAGRAEVTGPGRLTVRLNGVPFAADYWVLWVDEGYRTAVVGSPKGRAGWILNRDPVIPADRLRAAREVLAFNGYDLTELRMTPQGGP
jgi:apolipoprotein D and lipocalin family protein